MHLWQGDFANRWDRAHGWKIDWTAQRQQLLRFWNNKNHSTNANSIIITKTTKDNDNNINYWTAQTSATASVLNNTNFFLKYTTTIIRADGTRKDRQTDRYKQTEREKDTHTVGEGEIYSACNVLVISYIVPSQPKQASKQARERECVCVRVFKRVWTLWYKILRHPLYLKKSNTGTYIHKHIYTDIHSCSVCVCEIVSLLSTDPPHFR